jgi:hypothetical protein
VGNRIDVGLLRGEREMDEMGGDENRAIESDDRNGVRFQDNVRFSFTQVVTGMPGHGKTKKRTKASDNW